jgi:hypothetical protein
VRNVVFVSIFPQDLRKIDVVFVDERAEMSCSREEFALILTAEGRMHWSDLRTRSIVAID